MNQRRLGYITILVFVCAFLSYYRLSSTTLPMPPVTASITNHDRVIIAPAILDAPTDLVRLYPMQSGFVKTILVHIGERVNRGTPLISLDDTAAKTKHAIAQIKLQQAKTHFLIQKKQVEQTQKLVTHLKALDKRARSAIELDQKIQALAFETAALNQAKQQIALAKATLKQTELTLHQLTITAPKDGIIFDITPHINEFVMTAQPLILLGDPDKIMVRAAIAERDIDEFNPQLPAYLISTDPTHRRIPLTFVQLDQHLVTPPHLNANVQEVIYFFPRKAYSHAVAGQQLDVTISK